jgi:hypothetical protein
MVSIPTQIFPRQLMAHRLPEFINLLNMMRKGEINSDGISIFRKLERELIFKDNIKPTEL